MITIDDRKRSVLVWIPARGGSKGLPGKSLQDLGGMPVIAHTILAARESQYVDRIVVNTDDKEISAVAHEYGAEVPFLRPGKMATDTSDLGEAFQYQQAWLLENEGYTPDITIGMSPTYPFRKKGRVDEALKLAQLNPLVVCVRSVSPSGVDVGNYWNLTGSKVDSFVEEDLWTGEPCPTYQNLFSFNVILHCRPYIPEQPQTGMALACTIDTIESIDIDEPKDLEVARLALELGKFGNSGDLRSVSATTLSAPGGPVHS